MNQATYSTIASSSWERERQTRSRISSVLNLSTKLGERVVVGVADGADRREHLVVVEGLCVGERGVLAAGVAVMNERDLLDPLGHGEGHPERVEHEIGTHVRCELPANDLAVVGVDHEREENEALPAAQIGEVRDPELIAAGGAEVALDQVRPPPCRGVGDRRPPRLPAPLRALDLVSAHQPLHSARADLLAPP